MDYKRVLMLRFTNGMNSREIAETTGDGKTTVNEFLKRFRECTELSYPLSEEVTNEFIEGVLYRKAANLGNSESPCTPRPPPNACGQAGQLAEASRQERSGHGYLQG